VCISIQNNKKQRDDMAEETAKPKNKLIIYIVAGIVVIVLEVFVAYALVTKFLMPSQPVDSTEVSSDTSTVAKKTAVKKEKKKATKKTTESESSSEFSSIQGMYTLADFVINPANSNGKHFFVFTVVYAFEDKTMEDLIKEREPILKDKIIAELGKKTFEWYGIVSNREAVRQKLLEIGQEILGVDRGVHVYFTKYVLQ